MQRTQPTEVYAHVHTPAAATPRAATPMDATPIAATPGNAPTPMMTIKEESDTGGPFSAGTPALLEKILAPPVQPVIASLFTFLILLSQPLVTVESSFGAARAPQTPMETDPSPEPRRNRSYRVPSMETVQILADFLQHLRRHLSLEKSRRLHAELRKLKELGVDIGHVSETPKGS